MNNRIDDMHEPAVDLDGLYESTLIQIDGDKVILLVKPPGPSTVIAELQAGHMENNSTYGNVTLMEIISRHIVAAYRYHFRALDTVLDLMSEYHIDDPSDD